MRDDELLQELLSAENEIDVLKALDRRSLLDPKRVATQWRPLGGMPNNQSIVHNQQSTPAAALVEKYTNGVDALLIRACRKRGIDPRGPAAPQNMATAIETLIADTAAWTRDDATRFAEERLLLYATGSKARPSLSLYDAGEAQLPQDFPTTFCSLIYGSNQGSYKGAIPFVQGRFNMGGTGVLPFCSELRKLQLIISRVPPILNGHDRHEWGFTLVCFFPSKRDPSWQYLVGSDGQILTAGTRALRLVPKIGARSGEVSAPREREVESGTLIKMYDFQAPRSNVCGELYKKVEEFLLRPALPLRVVECRPEYKANVMRVTIWDRLGKWREDKLESGFTHGADIRIPLSTGEAIDGEIRVFRAPKNGSADDDESPVTGVRALINGQSHAKRDGGFFRTQEVDKEHIAASMLVTLDCTGLGQGTRNALFMSNRESFRDDPLLTELLKKLKRELHDHEGLILLNQRRYEEKLKNAATNDAGVSALEELLATDPTLAELFGSDFLGRTSGGVPTGPGVDVEVETPLEFKGREFPAFFKRRDGATSIAIEVPRGGMARPAFFTDVVNNYFTRRRNRGRIEFETNLESPPTQRLFNGRLTLTCAPSKDAPVGSQFSVTALISDTKGTGPFLLEIAGTVVEPKEHKKNGVDQTKEPRKPSPPKAAVEPSRPQVIEKDGAPTDPPLIVEKDPKSGRLQLVLNKKSEHLEQARKMRDRSEHLAVEFVFKYGLALVAMGLLDAARRRPEWEAKEAETRDAISQTCTGVARVIVPLCLSLREKLPRSG